MPPPPPPPPPPPKRQAKVAAAPPTAAPPPPAAAAPPPVAPPPPTKAAPPPPTKAPPQPPAAAAPPPVGPPPPTKAPPPPPAAAAPPPVGPPPPPPAVAAPPPVGPPSPTKAPPPPPAPAAPPPLAPPPPTKAAPPPPTKAPPQPPAAAAPPPVAPPPPTKAPPPPPKAPPPPPAAAAPPPVGPPPPTKAAPPPPTAAAPPSVAPPPPTKAPPPAPAAAAPPPFAPPPPAVGPPPTKAPPPPPAAAAPPPFAPPPPAAPVSTTPTPTSTESTFATGANDVRSGTHAGSSHTEISTHLSASILDETHRRLLSTAEYLYRSAAVTREEYEKMVSLLSASHADNRDATLHMKRVALYKLLSQHQHAISDELSLGISKHLTTPPRTEVDETSNSTSGGGTRVGKEREGHYRTHQDHHHYLDGASVAPPLLVELDRFFFALVSHLKLLVAQILSEALSCEWSDVSERSGSPTVPAVRSDDRRLVGGGGRGDAHHHGLGAIHPSAVPSYVDDHHRVQSLLVSMSNKFGLSPTASTNYLPHYRGTSSTSTRTATSTDDRSRRGGSGSPTRRKSTSAVPSYTTRQRELKLAWQLAWLHAVDVDRELWDDFERKVVNRWLTLTRVVGSTQHQHQHQHHAITTTRQESSLSSEWMSPATKSEVIHQLQALWERCTTAADELLLNGRDRRNLPSSSPRFQSSSITSPSPTSSILRTMDDLSSSPCGVWMSTEQKHEPTHLMKVPRGSLGSGSVLSVHNEFGRFRQLVCYRREHNFPPPVISELRSSLL